MALRGHISSTKMDGASQKMNGVSQTKNGTQFLKNYTVAIYNVNYLRPRLTQVGLVSNSI